MGVKVKHDFNNVAEYMNLIKQLNSKKVKIGIFSEAGANILMIAHVNEFGINIEVTDAMRGYLGATGLHLKKDTKYITIPERSYIRGGYDSKKSNIYSKVRRDLTRVIEGKLDVDKFFERVGTYCVGVIQEYMTDLKDPPNKPYTIEKKGSTNPLIATGELRSKITYKVE